MALAPNTYLWASVAIGAAQLLDAIALAKYPHRFGVFTTIFSLAEYAWAAVSFFVWRAAEDPFPHWLPVSFIAYVASFFAAGLVLAAHSRGKDIEFPKHLIVPGGVFGVFFAAASAFYAAAA